MEIVKATQTEPQPKYRGVEIDLDGQKFILPAVPMGFFRANRKYFDEIRAKASEEGQMAFQSLADAADRWYPYLLASFNRNYPEITAKDLDQIITPQNFNEVIAAVNEACGLKAKAGEQGETEPVVQ